MSTLKVEKIQHPNSASVALTLDTSGNLALQAGSAAAPAIQGPSDPNTGIFFPAADTIAFAEGGVERARLDSSGRLLVGTSTASGSALLQVLGDAQVASINGGPIGGARNRIINGDMRIDQRNAGASVTPTTSVYTLDRWLAIMGVTSKYSVQRNAGSVTPPTGFTNYLGITSTSAYASGATDAFLLNHYIEGFNTADLAWGTVNALTATLSFWIRCSIAGTYSLSICNSPSSSSRAYIATYTVNSANTWEYKTATIPGDTSGTWDTTNGIGVQVRFDLGSGSSFNGTAGSWGSSNLTKTSGSQSVVGTNGATFYITGVQLEAGTIATPFERRSYGQELALCQRYYYSSGTVRTTIYADNATSDGILNFKFPISMRAAPTIAQTSGGTTLANTGTISTQGITTEGFQWTVGSSSGAGMRGSTACSYTATSEL